MAKQKIFTISTIAFCCAFILGCSSESDSGEFYHYDTSLDYNEQMLLLDSISNCIIDSAETEYHSSIGTIFISNDGEKPSFTFPSYLLSSKDNIKSIGVYAIKDTLKIELLEKKKTPGVSLDCPIWVYSTPNGDISTKYILTRSGVYPIEKK